jgi:hypothetical protein
VVPGHQQQAYESMHELDEQVGVVGPHCVLDRRERIVLCCPPACRAAVQIGGPPRPRRVFGVQVGRHERVDPESPGRPALDEPAVASQPVQHLAGVAPATEDGCQGVGDRPSDADPGEQITVRHWQDGQYLAHEEVGRRLGVGGGEPLQEGARIDPAAQNGGGELNPDGPAAGAGVQLTRLGPVELEVGSAQHLVGLVGREAQPVDAELAQLPCGPQRPERERGVPAGAEDEAHPGRTGSDERLEARQHRWIGDLVNIVQDQRHPHR